MVRCDVAGAPPQVPACLDGDRKHVTHEEEAGRQRQEPGPPMCAMQPQTQGRAGQAEEHYGRRINQVSVQHFASIFRGSREHPVDGFFSSAGYILAAAPFSVCPLGDTSRIR